MYSKNIHNRSEVASRTFFVIKIWRILKKVVILQAVISFKSFS